MLRRLRHVLPALLVLPTALLPAVAAAADYSDKILIQPTGTSGKKLIVCEIEDYDAKWLTVLEPNIRDPRKYHSEEVSRIETHHVQPYLDALAALGRNDIDAAENSLRQALDEEGRAWVRREILAYLVRVALWRGDYVTAAGRFQAIVDSRENTRFYNLFPLVWSERTLQPGQADRAYPLLTSERPHTRLVGASILAFHPGFGPLAQKELRALTEQGDDRIRRLAEAQLWRVRLHAEEAQSFDLDRWGDQLKVMPSELRGGPSFVLGQAQLRFLRREAGALLMLRVPILYDHDRLLAAEALLQAGDALSAHGRPQEARALYREVRARYVGTPAAGEADSILKDEPSS